MFSLEEAATELSNFGLTSNQARVYIALVKLGVAPVSKISLLSKIRREEIYRLMPKLEQLGIVERIIGKPMKYKPISLEETLSVLIKDKQEESEKKIAELAEKKASLLRELESLENKEVLVAEEEKGSNFILILDRDKSLRKLSSMTDAAKKEIVLTAGSSDIQYGVSQNYDDSLRMAVMRGVKVRVLLQIDEVSEPLLYFAKEIEQFKDIIEVRHVDQLKVYVTVVDDKETSIGTYLDPNTKEVVNLWTDNPSFVRAMKDIFEKQWSESVDIWSRIEYLQTGKPIERTEVLRRRDKIYEYLRAARSKIKSNLLMMGDATLVELFKRVFMSESLELKNRDVRVRLLTHIDEDNLEVAAEIAKHFEIKHLDRVYMRAVLGDEEIGFSWITIKAMPEEGIYSNNPEIVRMLWEMVEDAWDNAVDAQSRITELETGKPIERIEVIKGRDTLYEIAYAIDSRAKTDKLTILDDSGLELIIRDFTSINIELKKRGVRVRYLTNVTDQNLQAVEDMSKQFEVRHTDNVPFRFLLTETEVALSWIPVKEMPDSAIYSNDAELVHILWKIAENAWDNAIDAQTRIDEIRNGKPVGRVSKPVLEQMLESRKREM